MMGGAKGPPARTATERSADSRAARMAQGARIVSAVLPPDAVRALERICQRRGLTVTQAIAAALLAFR
jgi:hypothetical protein